MDIPPPEPTHTKITFGSFSCSRLQNLPASYPFTQQVDIVFPSSDSLEAALSKLYTRFMKGKFGLSDVYEQFANSSVKEASSYLESIYLTVGLTDDRWCIDLRGVLTLCVTKDTYERLGLVGSKLPFKHCQEQYVIRIPLHDKSESVGMKAKRKKALQDWDRWREQDGLGKWDVIFCRVSGLGSVNTDESQQYEVKPQIRKSSLIHIPTPSSIRTAWSDSRETQEWHQSIADLFEWVGMACLGAQRLEANDRVDPYVSVYSPPSPSQVGTITHLRWRGLLSSAFVKLAIDSVISLLSMTDVDPPSFISIIAHAFPSSPVTYVPPGAGLGGTAKEAPLRVPRIDTEHCWSSIFVPGLSKEDDWSDGKSKGSWIMAESIGKWDMRWG